MQAKILQMISNYLLLPLIKKAAMWVISAVTRWYNKRQEAKRRKEAEKINLEKAETYENSTTDNSTDDFSELP